MYDLTEYELGWIVGFLEGEGSFHTHKTGRYAYPRVACGNTDRAALERLQRSLGGTIYDKGQKIQAHYLDQWQWQVAVAAEAKGLMEFLRPHMNPKRQAQIDAAIQAYEGRFGSKGTLVLVKGSTEAKERMAKARAAQRRDEAGAHVQPVGYNSVTSQISGTRFNSQTSRSQRWAIACDQARTK
jgi:hypothetical protein